MYNSAYTILSLGISNGEFPCRNIDMLSHITLLGLGDM